MQELASLPMRGAWIEIYRCFRQGHRLSVAPMRGAWIEIPDYRAIDGVGYVAPHAGGVD